MCTQPGSNPVFAGHTLPPEVKSGENAVILTLSFLFLVLDERKLAVNLIEQQWTSMN